MLQAKPRQKLFGFMYKKKKESIQPLLGKIDKAIYKMTEAGEHPAARSTIWGRGKFDRFFKLRNKLLVEFSGTNFTTINEIKPSGIVATIGNGHFSSATDKMLANFPNLPNKKTAAIHYAIYKNFHNKAYLRKGVATKIVEALLEKARLTDYERIIAIVKPENLESQGLLKKFGFIQLQNIIASDFPIWYKNI